MQLCRFSPRLIARKYSFKGKGFLLSRFCVKAKALLDERGIDYEVFELDKLQNPSQLISELISYSNQKTVPNIFANGSKISSVAG